MSVNNSRLFIRHPTCRSWTNSRNCTKTAMTELTNTRDHGFSTNQVGTIAQNNTTTATLAGGSRSKKAFFIVFATFEQDVAKLHAKFVSAHTANPHATVRNLPLPKFQ